MSAKWSSALTTWADPFVTAFLFPMMQLGQDVLVEGKVSPSLLASLEEFMALWHAWAPGRYRPVDITAEEEVESPPPALPGQTITPFSCGVDSSCLVYCHHKRLVGRRTRNITAGVVMNGFDIWLDQPNGAAVYDALLQNALRTLASVNIDCIALSSNFHELPSIWAHSYCTHLVGGLRLLAGRFDSSLVSACVNYNSLGCIWAGHPLCYRLLGSRNFQIFDDASDVARYRKVEVIPQWPEALENLRVCFSNGDSHTNCCRCEKCIRNIMCFRVAGKPLPPAFAHDATDRQIRRIRLNKPLTLQAWKAILKGAKECGLSDESWVKACRAAVRRGQRRIFFASIKQRFIPLRNRIRAVFRGSSLSRRELAARVAPSASSRQVQDAPR